MKSKKTEEDIANYRLEKINKIKKKPAKKGFFKLFEEKQIHMNSPNFADGSMSQKIFNNSGNKKNVTLRMLDFEQDTPIFRVEDKGTQFITRIKYFSYIIYIITFIMYKQSLLTCESHLSMNDCVEKYDIKEIIQCFIKCVCAGFILSINISLIFYRLLPTAHIFGFVAFLFALLVIDMGNDLYSHGLINYIIILCSLIYGFLFYILLKVLMESLVYKKFKTLFLMITILVFVIAFFILVYFLITNCRYWEKGFNKNKINNDLNEYSCKIMKPNTCYMDVFGFLFDFSRLAKFTCDKNNNPLFRDVLDNYVLYYDNEFPENISVLNYPKTNNMDLYSDQDISLEKKIMNKVNGSSDKDLENSEVFLVKDKSTNKANIEMNINKNVTLEKERRQLTKNTAKIRNILVIYFDSLSRAHFHRKFSDFGGFLSDLSDISNGYYESFEFLKYHTFGNQGQNPTLLSMFLGKDYLAYDKPVHIISHLKNNGYITAQSANICSQNLNKNINSNILNEKFDHENIAMFCDPLYNAVNNKNYNTKGINSSFKRCLYGKNTYEYVFNYGKLFWDAYPNNNKFLLLGFFDSSERSGEVVKYMDNSLSDFLLDLINQGKFHKTALLIVSSSGELKLGIFNKLDNEYFYERNLASFFLVLHKVSLEKELLEKIKINQQSFVTAYDIYDTLLSIGYDCYDEDCWKNIKNKSKKGQSVFSIMNNSQRNCQSYREINDNECFCWK